MDDNTGTVLAYFILFGLPVLSFTAFKITRLILDHRKPDEQEGQVER